NGFLFPNDATDTYLVFNAGSTFEIQRDGASIPKANYDPASTILINGCINNGLAFNESVAIGNLTYNCPAQNGIISLALLNINVKGDMKIQNTNNKALTIVGNGSVSNTTINVIVEKNLEIS